MSFYIDMTSVLDTFKTEIKVISNSSSGDWIDGQWVEDDAVFESVVSFTVYAKKKLQALNLSNQMRLLLRGTASNKRFFENNITLVEIMATQPRYVEETNNYAYMYGFDVRLRLKETYVDEDKGTIEFIDYKEK